MARRSLTPFRSGGLISGGDPFLSLHREMNRMIDDVFRSVASGPMTAGSVQQGGALLAPQMNVSETEDQIRISAELPGVAENDVQVELNDDVLVIRGEKKLERKEDKENYHFVERAFGTFQRTLQLPFPADPEQVQARFENGVLMVTVPKTQPQDRSRRIQVQGSGSAQQGASSSAQETSSETDRTEPAPQSEGQSS